MRRESLWLFGAPTITTLASASQAVLLLSLNAAGLALRPFTIVRTRGLFQVSSDQAATTEEYNASVGSAVVSDQASAIGITAIPTPETDRSSDLWFVYETIAGNFTVSSAIGLFEAGHERVIDSKAMRKVEDGEDFVTVIETSVVSSGARVYYSDRVLVKLH